MAQVPKRDPIAPPTIAHLRSQGVKSARMFCGSNWCGHMVVIPFDDLGLSDLTPFADIRNHRRWVCQRCGGREVSVMPDWRDPQVVQAERLRQGS